MGTIKDEAGLNDCEFNIQGKCTNPEVSRGKPYFSGKDWDSKVNCVLTQYGTRVCHVYKRQN